MAIQSQLPGSIVESIAIANAKSVAEQPATLSNLSLGNLAQNVNLSQQNTVSHQHNVNGIEQAVLSKAVTLLVSLGPLEAMSTQQILKGNAAAQALSALKAAVAPLTSGVSSGGVAGGVAGRGPPGRTPGNPIRNWSKIYVRPTRNVDVVVENT